MSEMDVGFCDPQAASPADMKALQDCYDNMTSTYTFVKKQCKELASKTTCAVSMVLITETLKTPLCCSCGKRKSIHQLWLRSANFAFPVGALDSAGLLTVCPSRLGAWTNL